jgi:hypothetical protein
VSTGAAVARWELTVRPGQLPWTGLAQVAGCWQGEFLLADGGCGSPWADIADIIMVSHEPPLSGSPSALGDQLACVFAGHPGCAIVVTSTPHWCALAVRDGPVARLALADDRSYQRSVGQSASAMSPIMRETAAMGGCLAHAWLVSGRSLELLGGSCLRVAAHSRGRGCIVYGQASGAPFLFDVVLEQPEAAGLLLSRVRTWSASGASILL